ncbi:MAG: hypothetical protein Q8R39_01005 [bacterium]|nr:hypothetical protein [bacterium]MDZ4285009.1 hypothetical protein [Patescibacteria group bacterium]
MADERDKRNFERREGAVRPPFESGPRNISYQPSSNQSMPMEPKNNPTTKVIVIFVLGFVAGFAVSQTFLTEPPGGSATNDRTRELTSGVDKSPLESDTRGLPAPDGVATEENDTVEPSGEIVSGPSAITIESQPAGETVAIKRLVLGERGWVVIHEDERGRPGRILGAGRFLAGVHADVPVELLRSTESGGVYYGMIHTDDGDDLFDAKLDAHLPDETGSPIMVRFSAL